MDEESSLICDSWSYRRRKQRRAQIPQKMTNRVKAQLTPRAIQETRLHPRNS